MRCPQRIGRSDGFSEVGDQTPKQSLQGPAEANLPDEGEDGHHEGDRHSR
jgi:hypothetical protein